MKSDKEIAIEMLEKIQKQIDNDSFRWLGRSWPELLAHLNTTLNYANENSHSYYEKYCLEE